MKDNNSQKISIRFFDDKEVRAIWDNLSNSWLFSVVDIIAILTESTNQRKYMLFDKEFEFKGKYATYVRMLRDEKGIFKTGRECYLISSIVGFILRQKGNKDYSEKVQAFSVLPSELVKQKRNLTFIYRLMMLLDDADGFIIDDYKDRTFRDDADDLERIKADFNMEIFNTYALGGLEYMHNLFKDCSEVEDVINILHDFIDEFMSENEDMINKL